MSKKRYVLLEPDDTSLGHFGKLDAWVCRTAKDVARIAPHTSKSSVWISFNADGDDNFLKSVLGKNMHPGGRLLALKPPRIEILPLLTGFFQSVYGIGPAFRYLPDQELADVLGSTQEEASNLFIGGTVDATTGAVGLIRGDVTMLVVPLAVFRPNKLTRPDPGRLAFTDYGHTVCMGDYEASADSLLYEFDPVYRARVNAQRRGEEMTFGASLRRRRRQLMLRRVDFAPVSAKTIARIERGEIERPHGRTLTTICKRLGVSPTELETF